MAVDWSWVRSRSRAPLADLVPPFLHDGIDAKNVLEIAGLGALLPWTPRFAAWPGISGGRAKRAMAGAPDIAGSGSIGSGSASAEVASRQARATLLVMGRNPPRLEDARRLASAQVHKASVECVMTTRLS